MRPPLATVARGDGSRIVDPQRVIVRNAAEWQALWAAHAGPESVEPPIDFATTLVVAVFAGERPTPGFGIDILADGPDGQAPLLRVDERAPSAHAIAAQMIVSPFHMVAIPRHLGDPRFADEPASPVRRDPVERGHSALQHPMAVPSTTGLDPTIAAALAYLAGPFSGVVILVTERTNGFVKFHAWQSILGLGGIGAVALLLLVTAFLALFVTPVGFVVMYWSAAVAAVVCVVVMVVGVVNAFTGHAWKLPIVGNYAERRATRV